jgi:hypothetical protein
VPSVPKLLDTSRTGSTTAATSTMRGQYLWIGRHCPVGNLLDRCKLVREPFLLSLDVLFPDVALSIRARPQWALSTRCRCTTSPVRQLLPLCKHAMTQSCSGRFERTMVIRRKLVGHEHHWRCGFAHRSIVWHVPRCDIPFDEPDGATPHLVLGDLLNGQLDFPGR